MVYWRAAGSEAFIVAMAYLLTARDPRVESKAIHRVSIKSTDRCYRGFSRNSSFPCGLRILHQPGTPSYDTGISAENRGRRAAESYCGARRVTTFRDWTRFAIVPIDFRWHDVSGRDQARSGYSQGC